MNLIQTLLLFDDSTKPPSLVGRRSAAFNPQLDDQVDDDIVLRSRTKYAQRMVTHGKPGRMIDIDPDGDIVTREKTRAFDNTAGKVLL